jgi:hypothetical protein
MVRGRVENLPNPVVYPINTDTEHIVVPGNITRFYRDAIRVEQTKPIILATNFLTQIVHTTPRLPCGRAYWGRGSRPYS